MALGSCCSPAPQASTLPSLFSSYGEEAEQSERELEREEERGREFCVLQYRSAGAAPVSSSHAHTSACSKLGSHSPCNEVKVRVLPL